MLPSPHNTYNEPIHSRLFQKIQHSPHEYSIKNHIIKNNYKFNSKYGLIIFIVGKNEK